MLNKTIYSVLFMLFTWSGLKAQQAFEVVILSDAAEQENHLFESAIITEITALLGSKYELSFTEVYMNGDISKIKQEIANVFAQNQAEVLIATGITSSQLLANQPTFPIPSMASIQINNNKVTGVKSSGISNFTYLNSPFNIKSGIEKLQEICRAKKLAILTDPNLLAIGRSREKQYAEVETEIEWLALETDLSSTVAQISTDVEGVYVLSSLANYTTDEIALFFEEINARELPSFSLLDDPLLTLGAYASFAASDNLKKIPRRIALNVEQIAEGKDPKDFSVEMETFTQQLVVNMETVNKIGTYPDWNILDNAILININRPSTERTLNLKAAIAEGIQNNLGYQIEAKQTEISANGVGLARSSYLPQLDVETTGFFLDENTVNSSFGTRGYFNWTAGASFSQLILSEPALANIAIQKLLLESQQQVQNQSELDVILEVAQRYFNYRQVLSVADLQNENIKAVNQNLTIASDKEKVGYSGASDVYRWQTELNLAKTDLYNTNAQLKAANYQLNETLNRPIGEVFVIENTEDINQLVEGLDDLFIDLIQNQTTLNQFADFMVNEAFNNLPELKQVELAIAAQERQLKSNNRAFYLPTVAFVADYDYPIATVNPGESLPIPDLEINNEPTWNAAFSVSIPIFAGGSRKYQQAQTKV
ncbi:MAG: TolC family protein, partial [Bacteroidota bacterium]